MTTRGSILPVSDLRRHVAALRGEIDEAIARVLDRGWFILGEENEAFESEFAACVAAPYAVGVANGTDAIHLALRALGVGPGDRVLTAPNSAVPTACGITQAGAEPCFADVDLEHGLLDPDAVAAELSPAVRAIVVVHLYGRCAPMDRLLEIARRAGIPVVEDAAQAHGATWRGRNAGTLGDLGCWSFYPTKNLGALGDGGAITGARPELRTKLLHLRNYGQEDRYHHVELGFNSRLDELQAAILRVKLRRLSDWNTRRREIAGIYREAFRGLPAIVPGELPEAPSVEHLFVLRVARRDRFRRELETRGVGTLIHFPIPIHLQGAYRHLGLGPGRFPNAERRAGEIVSLPLFPEMTASEVDRVVSAVTEALQGEPHPDEARA